ncbi:unnamed protein product [Pleuronectes platessa]|uniref:Uncharacterized protein n=1 Tax=Pleuronectes platessa TaxID=8262 RepID=A0A9N7UNP3_PLEPL|nr:unnamed protein product [Pleuronectes platessa]
MLASLALLWPRPISCLRPAADSGLQSDRYDLSSSWCSAEMMDHLQFSSGGGAQRSLSTSWDTAGGGGGGGGGGEQRGSEGISICYSLSPGSQALVDRGGGSSMVDLALGSVVVT